MKLFTTRQLGQKDVKEEPLIVADLDQIICEPVAFKFGGKAHYLKPVSTKEFLKVTEVFAKMEKLGKENKYTVEELVDVYADLISSLCDTIGKKELLTMSQIQVGALFQLILDHVTGKNLSEEAKKKHQQMAKVAHKA